MISQCFHVLDGYQHMSNTEKIPSSDLLETVNLVIFRIIRLDGEEIIRSKTSCRNKLVRKILLPGVNWAAMTNSGNEKQQEIRQVLRLRIGPTDVRRSPIGSGRTPADVRRTFTSPTGLRDRTPGGVRRTSATILGLKLFSEVRVGLRRVRFESVRTPVKPKIAV